MDADWTRLGVPWMRRYEAREAIPPVMTEFIGTALMAHLRAPAPSPAEESA